MGGFEPLAGATPDVIAETLGRQSFDTPLEERTRFANALLAWAEIQGPAAFARYRGVVFDCEMAICARAWCARVPQDDTKEAVAKLCLAFEAMTRGLNPGVRYTDFREMYGPDIPGIVNSVHTRLLEARS
jgi:hypothetical protein